jgi:DNA-3-methyladenine glycosylase I
MLGFFIDNIKFLQMSKLNSKIKRCSWCESSELMIKYHDTEWGTPLHDDRKLFEFLVLDAFQAGLSWSTILNKREHFRKVFDNFDPHKIIKYDQKKLNALLTDVGIIRNRLKIEGTITNAKLFLEVQKEYGSFDKYIWQFTGGKTLLSKLKPGDKIPANSPESDAMSTALRKKGFKFVGTTICYAFMQAAGMINDHRTDCFRYKELIKKS